MEIVVGVEASPVVEERLAVMGRFRARNGAEVEERLAVELPLGSTVIEGVKDGAADGRGIVVFEIATRPKRLGRLQDW